MTRVKCECGDWRYFVSDWIGAVTETCYGCGYRSALRGREPEARRSRGGIVVPLCEWKGCTQQATTTQGTLCNTHTRERRNLDAREKRKRAKGLSSLRLQRLERKPSAKMVDYGDNTESSTMSGFA